jgi:predicted Fe-Mo cluster-binding NifX family protein
MKIAVSATEPNVDAAVDLRFGRCAYFVIRNLETEQFETVNNASARAAGGAGVATAQMIVGKGVGVVITGNCGPNAYQVLAAAGVKVLTGASGGIKDAIEKFQNNEYTEATAANVADHFGSGRRKMGKGSSGN